jgi:hypothetical protein
VCLADLYCGADDRGWPTATVITCRACGHQHGAAERREWLLRAAEDRLATAGEISQAVPALYGHDIRIGTIRVWAHRGRIAARLPHPDDPLKRPRYRVGDVLDIASRAVSRPARTTTEVPPK